MKYEKLNVSNSKKVFLCGIIVGVVLIIIINFFMSYAKYKSIDSVKLASGTITYSSADLNIIAMYKKDDDNSEYEPVDTIPTSGYIIDNSMSYCKEPDREEDIKNILSYENGKLTVDFTKKGTKCYLYFEKKLTLAELLKDFTTAESGTNFSKGSNGVLKVTGVDTGDNGKTLYKAEDNDGTSYFFRGQAKNNWLQFAGKRWRIIRINGDGTIRMIFQCSGDSCTNTEDAATQLKRLAYNSTLSDNTYIGYYNLGKESKTYEEAHTGTNPSTIAAYLNEWYGTNLAKYDSYIDQDAGFCNDRQKVTGVNPAYNSGTGYGMSTTSYAMWGRVVENDNNRTEQLPTLKCGVSAATAEEQETSVEVDYTAYQRDLFTKNGANKGNGKLEHPIGLITADEVLLAGGFYGSANSNYYLYTNQNYWTMSPYLMDPMANDTVFSVGDNGTLGYTGVSNTLIGVRPVINLKANTTFSEGTGNVNDPFVVKTN